MFYIQEREERCKTLAQPGIVPGRFGDGVPKPLMRQLMYNYIPQPLRPFAVDQVFGVKDRRGGFHSAVAGSLDVRYFFVGIRSYIIRKKLDDRFCRRGKVVKSR